MKTLVGIEKGPIFDSFFTEENKRYIESLGDVVWYDGEGKMTEEELSSLISDREVYIALWGSPALTEKVLQNAPSLKLMTVLGSTIAPFVSDAMWEKDIKVISGFDYFSESTAEGTVAYMLCALRNIPFYSERLKKGGVWSAPEDSTDGLIYKTVGVVSYGGVGKHLVRKLSNFNVKIKVYDIIDIPEEDKEKYHIEQCGIEELFSSCDVISVHTPYNSSTYHMIDRRLLSMIKKGGLFVNTARGEVVDQKALTELLTQGDFYAALDVYEKEPIDKDDPLLSLDNVLLLPHHGGVTTNLRSLLTHDLIRESADYIDRGIALKNEIKPEYAKNMSKH